MPLRASESEAGAERAGPEQPGAGTGLRRNRDWRALWFGQAVSVLGDNIFDITVVLWVGTVIARGASWAPVAVGAVLIAAMLPVLLLGPIAGVFADRWNHRRTMLSTDLIRTVLTLTLLTVPLSGDALPRAVQLAFVYTVVALNAAAAQFFSPARFALIARTVPPADRAQASSLTQASSSLAAVIGPPLAAPLLYTVGVRWALVANAGSFAVSFLAVRRVQGAGDLDPEVADRRTAALFQGVMTDFREGVRAFAGSRVLVAVCSATAVAMVGVGALNVLDVFFVSDNLHAQAKWLGFLGAAFGLGSVLGALLNGPVARRIGVRNVFWLGLVVAGVLMLAYSRVSSLAWAVPLLFLAGLPISAINAVLGPLIMDSTPRELLGRVIALINPAIQLASVLSMALATVLTSTVLLHFHASVLGVHLGPIDTVFGVAALLMVAAGLLALRTLRPAPPAQG
ncbi:MFS transporter [Actinacidiphila yanglinensis]|uniref:MFS transporter n=1 Tax=Actinacidiphila yanglinensis TaxID=310779 RepID=UPI001356858B|nr:MFS transporter [Actinacidiphila yanglinensis]